MEYPKITIGGKIYSLRAAKGMTQEQLAAILCVSPAAVSKWERNIANPNIEMLWICIIPRNIKKTALESCIIMIGRSG